MFEIIGFLVVWPIAWLVIGAIVNYFRVKQGTDVRDGLTAFLQGLVFPPFSLLASFDPRARATGQSAGMFWGGILGTALAVYIYLNFL